MTDGMYDLVFVNFFVKKMDDFLTKMIQRGTLGWTNVYQIVIGVSLLYTRTSLPLNAFLLFE